MKRLLAAVIVLLIALAGMAQGQSSLTKEEKKIQKKEQKRQFEKMMMVNTSQAIRSGYFILKADQIRGRGGFTTNVNPSINFVAVQGKDAYVQLGSETGLGYNGVGGVTLKGKITNYSVEQNKKSGSYVISLTTTGSSGSLSILMNVNVTGDMATASVQTNWGSRVDFSGDLVPAQGSGTYTGTDALIRF